MSEPTATTDRDTGDEVADQLPDVVGTPKLGTDDLSSVLEEVHDAHSKWYGIGLQLGLASTVLEGIEHQYARTEDMLRAMLKEWLKQVDPVPTWVALIKALKSKTVKEPSLAEKLVGEHHISPLSHGILIHAVSDVDARQKQILGRLQATTKEVDSQLDSYEATLQQRKKADPSDEAPETAQEIHMQRGQSHESGLKTDPVRALHMQFKQLMSRMSSVENRMSGVSGLNPTVPEDPETKEPDPLQDHLRTRNFELEEELRSLKATLEELEGKNEELVEKNTLLSTEKEDLQKETQSLSEKIVVKNDEIAKRAEDVADKAKDVARKSADYTSLQIKMKELEKEVKKLAEENKLLKSQSSDFLQSLEEVPAPPEAADCTQTSTAEQ